MTPVLRRSPTKSRRVAGGPRMKDITLSRIILMELLDHPVEPKKIVEVHRNLAAPTERVGTAWENLPAVQALKKHRAALIDELQSIMAKIEGTGNQTLKDLHERLRQTLVGFRQSKT